jgi:hypothetical protein
VDLIQYFGLATKKQAKELFCRFFPNADEEAKNAFVSFIPEDTVSMAELQGYLLKYRNNMNDLMTHFHDLNLTKKTPKSGHLNQQP